MGPPPEGALNLSAWHMIREIVTADPALNEAAWQGLRNAAGFLPQDSVEANGRRAVGGYLEF